MMKNLNIKETSQAIRTITDENLSEFPKETQELYLMRKEKGKAMFLTPKYYKSLYRIKKNDLKNIHRQNPNTPLNKVVSELIGSLPDFIPSEKILELTKFIIESWEAMQEEEKVVA